MRDFLIAVALSYPLSAQTDPLGDTLFGEKGKKLLSRSREYSTTLKKVRTYADSRASIFFGSADGFGGRWETRGCWALGSESPCLALIQCEHYPRGCNCPHQKREFAKLSGQLHCRL